jgi:hypothetical protein
MITLGCDLLLNVGVSPLPGVTLVESPSEIVISR